MGKPLVYNRDESCNIHVKAIGDETLFGDIKSCKVREASICNSVWGQVSDTKKAVFRSRRAFTWL